MNILCPRGRELKAEYMAWKNRKLPNGFVSLYEVHTYHAYRQHVEKCELCEEELGVNSDG